MLLGAAALISTLWAFPARAQQVTQPKPGAAGTWRLLGQTHADHGADHDVIVVKGPYDNFRKIKFKVTDAPLNMQHMVVTSTMASRTRSRFGRTSLRAERAA